MSSGKKGTEDLVFNDDFDNQPVESTYSPPPPPPSPPQLAQSSEPPPPPTTVQIPDVDDKAAVPAVSPGQQPSGKLSSPKPDSESLPIFTTSTAVPVTTGRIEKEDNESESVHPEPLPEGRFGWLSVKPFQKFFDVEDKTVLSRLYDGTKGPFKSSFLDDIEGEPDLYGPFWTVTTLIFFTLLSTNHASYSKHQQSDERDEDWDGDYSNFGSAALMYYIYFFGVGLLLFVAVRFYKIEHLSLVKIWCVYGYGMVTLIPALIGILLLQFFHDNKLAMSLSVLVALIGTFYSAGFILLNIRKELEGFSQRNLVLGCLLTLHVLIGLLIGCYFHWRL